MGHVGYTPAHLTQARPEPPSASYPGRHIYRRLFAFGGSSHSSLAMGIQTKHFFNNPSHLVLESLQGLCVINPSVALDTTNKGASPSVYWGPKSHCRGVRL
ncbi:hypothetical protein HETIRDRAFT_324192 [Heterobasidion irregulare TC 32-1]|uniref:Uncharacterized protein n=1 Tax=Heterobasidion irregulare (strain TC 32-1) TaxID=747525 RepID=W4JZ81_HETIT|nr:uncharacterized protein HETIRDRAFT_324192 [Heterobasidion irregulare TC 32-1]ETW78847.1 hypothetical protein HETIRDRAFT_324192 [Heterobasidion irregulare TC 32-1]